jgi:hypothetical protein
MNLKAGRGGRRADIFARTNLGHRFEPSLREEFYCQCDIFLTCIVFTTTRTGIGRNIFI